MPTDPPIIKLLPSRQRPQRKDKIVIALVFLAIGSLIVEYGFAKPLLGHVFPISIQLATIAAYIYSRVVDFARASEKRKALSGFRLDIIILATAAMTLLLIIEFSHEKALKVSSVAIAVLQGLLAVRIFVGALTHNIVTSDRPLHPARFMAASFIVIILVGTLLLALPTSINSSIHDQAKEHTARHVLNCFFTATSAACVTGLAVYDTQVDFSPFGQFVILCLIQLGGLGIMMFGSVFGMLAGRQLSLRQSLIAQDSLSYTTFGEVRQLIAFVVSMTFACEFIGAVILWNLWPHDVAPDFNDRLFFSVFHAVSAFCNAGFALNTHSLIPYANHWQVYCSIMPLIILGGLGFPVLRELYLWFKGATGRNIRRLLARKSGKPFLPTGHRVLSLHSRVVLTTTAMLIVFPALIFFIIATLRGNQLADVSWTQRSLASIFQSVTARTAGFNTIPLDVNSVSHANHFLLAILMFIGGSPGSTAGGVKTVSFAVLLIGVTSTLRKRSEVEAFHRSIPLEVMRKSAAVIFLMFALVSLITLLLLVSENRSLIETLFESVSACGTVGLSTGLTPELTIPGRIIIIVAMFAGRLGPLTLLVALAGQQSTVRYQYPQESLMIG